MLKAKDVECFSMYLSGKLNFKLNLRSVQFTFPGIDLLLQCSGSLHIFHISPNPDKAFLPLRGPSLHSADCSIRCPEAF